jgi:hypothetical protein
VSGGFVDSEHLGSPPCFWRDSVRPHDRPQPPFGRIHTPTIVGQTTREGRVRRPNRVCRSTE